MLLKYKIFISVIVGLLLFSSLIIPQEGFRTEKDLLGEKQIPNSAYYGVQTLRALENFQISGVTTKDYPELVNAFVLVKLAGDMKVKIRNYGQYSAMTLKFKELLGDSGHN